MKKENSDSSERNNSFDDLKQKAKEDSLQRQKDISVRIRDHGIREDLEKKLSGGGVFLAGLSALNEMDILYLIGGCSAVERLRYISYEKKYLLKETDSFSEFHAFDKSSGRELDASNLHIVGSFQLEYPNFDEVSSFAENFGVSFDVTNENLLIAKEIKNTSFLFEMLKTNVHQFLFPIDDGMSFDNWYDKTSYEKSEYKILQNLICLYNTLHLDDASSKAFLNLMVYLRLKAHADDLYVVSENKSTSLIDSFRMKYTSEFINHLIPTQIDFSSDERFLILYFAIQKMKDALKNYPDKDLSAYLLNWLNAGVKKFEENIPDNFKSLNVELSHDVLNKSFLLDGEKQPKEMVGNKKAFLNEQPKQNLSLYDQIFSFIDKEMTEYDDNQQLNWKDELKLLPVQYHGLYKLSQLPDVYTFYALGIIDQEDLSLLTKEIKQTFVTKAVNALDEYYLTYMQQQEEVSEEIEFAYKVLQQAKKKNLFDISVLVVFLQKMGWSEEQINKINLETKEILSTLLEKDFDKYIPLALKFKKGIFTHVYNFRELSAYLTDKILGVDTFSLDETLSTEKCTQKDNPNLTKINRLMVIGDIFDEVRIKLPTLKFSFDAQIKLQKLVETYYENELGNIFLSVDEKKQKEQSERMKELKPSFSKFYSDDVVLSSEKETFAFLVKMAKHYLKCFSNSKATQEYYLNWFDFVMDFSETEKKELNSFVVSVPKYRRNSRLNDSMDKKSQEQFLEDMSQHYFTDQDRKSSRNDSRVLFGVCTDVDLLYAMGVLSPFEYSKIADKNRDLCMQNNGLEVTIFDTWTALQNEKPVLEFPIIDDAFKVMQQIKLAGELLDSSYNYVGIEFEKINYQKETTTITEFDLKKNPLRAEGKMLDTLLTIMKDLKEYNLENMNALRHILNSYWNESVQQLNVLAGSVEKKYPEITKRILDQKSLFGVKQVEKVETISDRLRYYPKLFLTIEKTLEKKYKYLGCLNNVKDFLEKEIKPFVLFYRLKDANLRRIEGRSREKE